MSNISLKLPLLHLRNILWKEKKIPLTPPSLTPHGPCTTLHMRISRRKWLMTWSKIPQHFFSIRSGKTSGRYNFFFWRTKQNCLWTLLTVRKHVQLCSPITLLVLIRLISNKATGYLCVSAFCRKKFEIYLQIKNSTLFQVYKLCWDAYFLIHCKVHC